MGSAGHNRQPRARRPPARSPAPPPPARLTVPPGCSSPPPGPSSPGGPDCCSPSRAAPIAPRSRPAAPLPEAPCSLRHRNATLCARRKWQRLPVRAAARGGFRQMGPAGRSCPLPARRRRFLPASSSPCSPRPSAEYRSPVSHPVFPLEVWRTHGDFPTPCWPPVALHSSGGFSVGMTIVGFFGREIRCVGTWMLSSQL